MLGAALIGGAVNYLLPANRNPDNDSFINPLWQCIVLGLGATLIVPLFLLITESKVIDDVTLTKPRCATDSCKADTSIKQCKCPESLVKANKDSSAIKTDSTQQATALPLSTQGKEQANKTNANAQASSTPLSEPNRARDYLIFAAYCMVAASAGFQFINKVINNVVTDAQLKKATQAKEEAEKANLTRAMNGQASQLTEVRQIQTKFISEGKQEFMLPHLPPVTVKNDPQKNRFGGKSVNRDRALKATVTPSGTPDFYDVTIWVESIAPETNPLNSDVVFYLHDSFSPSVYTISPPEFRDGKAIDDEIVAYGAFTVGAITDNGRTLLELDLSEVKGGPKEFKDR